MFFIILSNCIVMLFNNIHFEFIFQLSNYYAQLKKASNNELIDS